MALKQTEGKTGIVAEQSPVLELAMYNLYTWQGNTYERGKPYRFKYEDAMVLLSEQDHGRAIWRMYHPPVKKSAPKEEVVDATRVRADLPDPEAAFMSGRPDKTKGRIDVGSDDEIQDILSGSRGEEEDGNVTV